METGGDLHRVREGESIWVPVSASWSSRVGDGRDERLING